MFVGHERIDWILQAKGYGELCFRSALQYERQGTQLGDLKGNMIRHHCHYYMFKQADMSASLDYLTALMLAREKETYQM